MIQRTRLNVYIWADKFQQVAFKLYWDDSPFLIFNVEMAAKEIKENVVFLPLDIVKNSVGFSFDVGKPCLLSVLKAVLLLFEVPERTAYCLTA